jgi:hypothetical protein
MNWCCPRNVPSTGVSAFRSDPIPGRGEGFASQTLSSQILGKPRCYGRWMFILQGNHRSRDTVHMELSEGKLQELQTCMIPSHADKAQVLERVVGECIRSGLTLPWGLWTTKQTSQDKPNLESWPQKGAGAGTPIQSQWIKHCHQFLGEEEAGTCIKTHAASFRVNFPCPQSYRDLITEYRFNHSEHRLLMLPYKPKLNIPLCLHLDWSLRSRFCPRRLCRTFFDEYAKWAILTDAAKAIGPYHLSKHTISRWLEPLAYLK